MVLISCSSSKKLTDEQVSGKYQWKGIYGVGSTIDLKVDQTFEYIWQTGLAGGTTHGTWEREGTKIILNSDRLPSDTGIDDYEIIRTERENSDFLSIKVIGPDDENIPFAACVVKQGTKELGGAATDIQGETSLSKLDADSLIISFIGNRTIRFKLDQSISALVFKMIEQDDYYQYFDSETWTYRKDRLYSPSIKKDNFIKTKYYQRVK